MGSEFLRLPARASRDGDQPGEVVGTAIHVELLGYSATPPYLAGTNPRTSLALTSYSPSYQPRTSLVPAMY